MNFVAAKCPSCQGELQVPDDRDFVKCMYCGVDVKVREAVKMTLDVNIPNLIKLGNEALKSGNNKEAYHYFGKILESQIDNYEAWYGKGLSGAMQTTLADVRAGEMLTYFDNSLKYCPPEKVAKLKEEIADSIYSFSVSYYRLARKQLENFVDVANTWGDYLLHCSSILTCLEKEMEYFPKDETTIDFILEICKTNRGGYSYYQDRIVNGRTIKVSQRKTVSNEYYKELTNKITRYEGILKSLNPQKWERNLEIEATIKHNKKVINMCLFLTPLIAAFICAIIDTKYLILFIFLGFIVGAILSSFFKKPVPKKL